MKKSDVEALLQAQRSGFQGFLQVFMDNMTSRFDKFIQEFVEVKVSVGAITDRIKELSAKDSNLKEEHDNLISRIQKIEDHADYLENQSRRNNIRIDGIPESPNETWEATEVVVKDLLVHNLGLSIQEANNIKIERAHRTGKPRTPGSRPRPVVAKLASFKDREAILRRARDKKPKDIYFNEDFSARILETRRDQLPELKRQRDLGKIAYFSFDKLIVRNKPSVT